jgi:hypothetical protein
MTATSHEDQYICYHVSLSSSQNEKYFRKKVSEEVETRILCSVTLFRQLCSF